MKWNKNPVRAMKKLHSDIQSLRLMAKNDQHTIPEDWDSEKKNVLVIVTSKSKGGAQRVACQVASGLTAHYNVALIFGSDARYFYPLDERVRLLHIPLLYFDPLDLIKTQMLRRLKQDLRIDLSISLLLNMNRLNVRSKGRDRVIVSERNNPAVAYPETFAETKRIYAKADHVVFQTREVQSLYDEQTRAHSSILPNPVSVHALAAEQPAKKIVNVARLHDNKNQALLIRAFARFLPRHPGYTLEFYGEGSLLKPLKKLAKELGVQDAVIFHGNVDDVHEQIADAACFVLSSNVEGMPNALLEAMMMGLPCISTRCTGAKEVIRDGENGLLVEIGDEDGLVKALNRMIDDPALARRCAKNAVETAEDFRVENVIGQWIALCERELAKQNR